MIFCRRGVVQSDHTLLLQACSWALMKQGLVTIMAAKTVDISSKKVLRQKKITFPTMCFLVVELGTQVPSWDPCFAIIR